MSRLNWDHAQLGNVDLHNLLFRAHRNEYEGIYFVRQFYNLAPDLVSKNDPPCQIKIGVFWALLFPFTSLFLSWEEWFCRHLGVLSFQFHRVLKSSVLLFFLYIYLVIDCPKQKGKDVAIVAWCTFCRTNFSCTTNLRSQRLIKIWTFKYIFVVKKSGLRK